MATLHSTIVLRKAPVWEQGCDSAAMSGHIPEELIELLAAGRGPVVTRADLFDAGYSPKRITRAVRAGALIRLRRDRYAVPGNVQALERAVRVGGRLTCVSLLATTSAFVRFRPVHTHVHIAETMSRLRTPTSAKKRLGRKEHGRHGVRLHWGALIGEPVGLHAVSLADAVRAYVRCQSPLDVVATLDSILHQGILTVAEIDEAFAGLPARFRALRSRIDGLPESGTESLVREMLRGLGVPHELQVYLPGVGRVDFVIAGRLIVECDSKEFHSSEEQQLIDRRRDAAAARLGYPTLRLLANDIVREPEQTEYAIVGLLRSCGVQVPGEGVTCHP